MDLVGIATKRRASAIHNPICLAKINLDQIRITQGNKVPMVKIYAIANLAIIGTRAKQLVIP